MWITRISAKVIKYLNEFLKKRTTNMCAKLSLIRHYRGYFLKKPESVLGIGIVKITCLAAEPIQRVIRDGKKKIA